MITIINQIYNRDCNFNIYSTDTILVIYNINKS